MAPQFMGNARLNHGGLIKTCLIICFNFVV
jgi:hypothetical protein